MRGAEVSQPDPRMSHFSNIVLPVTLLKTVYEKQFIATEAKKALEFCAKGGAQALPETIDALVNGFKELKNLPLAEQSAFYL